MLNYKISRINAIRVYILVAISANIIFSVIRPEFAAEYDTAGFQMMALFLLTLI